MRASVLLYSLRVLRRENQEYIYVLSIGLVFLCTIAISKFVDIAWRFSHVFWIDNYQKMDWRKNDFESWRRV